MFGKGASFEKLMDKATSHLNIEVDWPSIIQICDLIRQGDVAPKTALASIKKRMTHANPHVIMFSLNVLESVVKNCGSPIHDEIGTKAYMETFKELIKTSQNENVINKLLELLQTWAHVFRNSPKYRSVQDTVNILKADGFKFPALKENDTMFLADTAPEWKEGDTCCRCRVIFGLFERKHHCRNCGYVFCSKCTSQSCTLPKFGIEKEVRVCVRCFEKVNHKLETSGKSEDLPAEYLSSPLSQQSQAPPRKSAAEIKGEEDLKMAIALSLAQAKAPPSRKTEEELKEEEDFNLAIALSQSEAEVKNKARSATVSTSRPKSYSPPPKLSISPESDPELAKYLNRSYWQHQNTEHTNASAPAQPAFTPPTNMPTQNGVEEGEMEEFVTILKSQIEMLVNRMKSNSSRGRPIANDSSVQSLFLSITAMHSRLLKYIQQQDDSRVFFEGLQDKLVQVKDAREALDALREEHKERLRREAEIAERQRQMQMAQKLDIMRKKKQEYLQYQRQLALQRIQEQEREMQMRQEQQKQQYIMGPPYGPVPPPYMPQGFDNGPIMPGRFPNPGAPPPPHNYPQFNPGRPVDPIMAQHMGVHGVPPMMGPNMMVSDTTSLPRVMMPPGHPQVPPAATMPGPPPHMSAPPHMPMAPPPPHMVPMDSQRPQMVPQLEHGPPPMGHMPPMGQAPLSQANSLNHVPQMRGGPPMGMPPMGQGPPVPQMNQPPSASQAPPLGQTVPISQVQPQLPSHILAQPTTVPDIKQEKEENTAELISFD
ncbi:hepatocyte growth factor-regulated tyrosine kinase substrate isoform X2 [Cimex lectularius]|uniref:Hepatocyte growth factor-regulated tyrosine kinase substrate n=1 Tax=Cimex lectularius TaxID=79782 RepID=A0A8I6RBA5_CIMLE|nr:hepatocyte growth factor-regulated tyrosine kinase substrate isoform X2 [Cimex lectularius]